MCGVYLRKVSNNFEELKNLMRSDFYVFHVVKENHLIERLDKLPHDVLFHGTKWFICKLDDELTPFEKNLSVYEIDIACFRTLFSSSIYPPSIAIANDKVHHEKEDSKLIFLQRYCDYLENVLSRQSTQHYFLAKARVDSIGTTAGYYYWIIENMGDTVTWVSDDYQLYSDESRIFEIEQ